MTHSERRQRRIAMAARVANGAAISDVAADSGVTTSAVYEAMRINRMSARFRCSLKLMQLMQRLMQSAEPYSNIAPDFGIGPSWVAVIASRMRAAGFSVPHRPSGRPTRIPAAQP
jgi:hypothetical protein